MAEVFKIGLQIALFSKLMEIKNLGVDSHNRRLSHLSTGK